MAGITIPANIVKTAKNWIISLGYTLGPTIIVFNFLNYRVNKSGAYFFLDGNKYGLAFGVFILALAMHLKKSGK